MSAAEASRCRPLVRAFWSGPEAIVSFDVESTAGTPSSIAPVVGALEGIASGSAKSVEQK
jgi:hypothetical protein